MLALYHFGPVANSLTALRCVLPDDCTSERAPLTTGWLSRMAKRPAVKALDDYRIKR